MKNLLDKPHVKSHALFADRDARIQARRERMLRHAQSLSGDFSRGSRPNLADMFSESNKFGLLANSKKLPDLIRVAIETARESLDQFDFPVRPALDYQKVINVKRAGTSDDVISGTIMLLCTCRTLTGTKQTFDIPVAVVNGGVVPPAVMRFQGRDHVLAQSAVDAIVQRASFYELEPTRGQFDPPQTREERAIATEARNDIGYTPRDGVGPISVCRRQYRKQGYIGTISETAEKLYDYIVGVISDELEKEGDIGWVEISHEIMASPEYEAATEDDIVNALDMYRTFAEKHEPFPVLTDAGVAHHFGIDPRQVSVEKSGSKTAQDDAEKMIGPPIYFPDDEGKEFDDTLIGRIFQWHGGQGTSEYSLASSWNAGNSVPASLVEEVAFGFASMADKYPDQKDELEGIAGDLGLVLMYPDEICYQPEKEASRVASMGTVVPPGYVKCKELMDKAQEDGLDTFPRSWIHVLRNYILEVVSTASQDSWMTHLVNDGYVINPYGPNRGREKTARVSIDNWSTPTAGRDGLVYGDSEVGFLLQQYTRWLGRDAYEVGVEWYQDRGVEPSLLEVAAGVAGEEEDLSALSKTQLQVVEDLKTYLQKAVKYAGSGKSAQMADYFEANDKHRCISAFEEFCDMYRDELPGDVRGLLEQMRQYVNGINSDDDFVLNEENVKKVMDSVSYYAGGSDGMVVDEIGNVYANMARFKQMGDQTRYAMAFSKEDIIKCLLGEKLFDEISAMGMKTAQAEDFGTDVSPDTYLYPNTKTPVEPGDSVKFEGHEGSIRGTIVEVDSDAGNAIVKSKGVEYRVSLDDIVPLNRTFKKMWAESVIRLSPPGKKYAEMVEDFKKDPNIDNPWGEAWEAYHNDPHSGPKDEGAGKALRAQQRTFEEDRFTVVVTYEFTPDGVDVVGETNDTSEAAHLYEKAVSEYPDAELIEIWYGEPGVPGSEEVTDMVLDMVEKYGKRAQDKGKIPENYKGTHPKEDWWKEDLLERQPSTEFNDEKWQGPKEESDPKKFVDPFKKMLEDKNG